MCNKNNPRKFSYLPTSITICKFWGRNSNLKRNTVGFISQKKMSALPFFFHTSDCLAQIFERKFCISYLEQYKITLLVREMLQVALFFLAVCCVIHLSWTILASTLKLFLPVFGYSLILLSLHKTPGSYGCSFYPQTVFWIDAFLLFLLICYINYNFLVDRVFVGGY